VLETTISAMLLLLVDRPPSGVEMRCNPPPHANRWRAPGRSRNTVPDFTHFLRFFATKFSPMATRKSALRPTARIRRDQSNKQRREIQQSAAR